MKVIFNGDDFGITKACNYALVDCYENGVMKSTSMMTNMPGAEHAAKIMKDYPGLSVGIHLSLTVGKPLTEGLKTIVKADGTLNKGILRNHEGVDLNEIKTEMEAQFNRFVELTGKLPDHVNSHHGICLVPGADKLVLELAKKHNLPVRRMFTAWEGNYEGCDYVIPKMVHIMKKDWSDPILPEDIINAFSKEMLESDDIYEIAGHPGYVDYELMQFSSLTNGRCYDHHNFVCDEIKNWVKENNIEVISYKDIPLK